MYYSHIHDRVAISRDSMEASTQKTQQQRMTRKMKQNSPPPSHCRHDDKFRGFMRTWDIHTSNRNLFSRIFAEKVESDGNRREVTSLEAPWRSDKTERAGSDCNEDYYKMTQDGSEASTRKVFEEDRVTVNQTKASKSNDSRYSEYQRVFGKNPRQVEYAVLECGGEGIGMMRWQQTGGLAADLALNQQRRSKRALYCTAKHYKGRLPVGGPQWFRRPFHDDDETDTVTEHMRDLGAVDSPPTQGESTATGLPGPDSEGQMDVEPEEWKRVKEKTPPVSPEQSTSALINTNSDAAPREAERDHDDKRRRVDELVSPVFTVAQDEVFASSPVHFDSETKNDEIAVDVALPEEPTGMSEESGRGWITEEAFFTVSHGWQQMRQRKEVKMNHLSPAEKREFLKSMQIEWQALLKSQASQGTISGRNGPSPSVLAGSCDGHSLGAPLEVRRKQDIGAPCKNETYH